jgi:hypothetical protein
MGLTTDYINERRDQPTPPPTDAHRPEGMLIEPQETEASFEEIER